jgi:very-short-patch-repair endonuclease
MVYSKLVTEAKQSLGASSNIIEKARELRKQMTNPEKILWNYLRKRQQRGMYFRRQHPYGIYILDFYCFEANLAIEVDGDIHLYKKEYDNERTRYLESSGLKVLRIKNKDVEERIGWVIDKINLYLDDLPPSQPSPRWEGDSKSFSPPRGKRERG